MIRRIVVPAALLLLVMAGCASPQDDAGSIDTGTTPAVSGSAPASASAPSALPEATKTGKPAAGSTTLTGTITAGVEPNCLLLQDGEALHLLIIQDAAQRASATVGSKVRVTGTPQPGGMSTCQQGEPFLVSSVTPE